MPISISGPFAPRAIAPPLRALIRAALQHEGLRPGEIAVVLTDDAALRALNRQWRGIDRATDVLSFSYDELGPGEKAAPRAGHPVIAANVRVPAQAASRRTKTNTRFAHVNGDLVISMDRVREQAKRFRVSEGRELARLSIHGALHLAGLDHQRQVERRHMRVREDSALRAVKVHVTELERCLK